MDQTKLNPNQIRGDGGGTDNEGTHLYLPALRRQFIDILPTAKAGGFPLNRH